MFFDNENTGGIFKSIRGCDEPINDGGNQTYSKSEQNKIVKNVKSKIKRLKKQQKELERLKNQQRQTLSNQRAKLSEPLKNDGSAGHPAKGSPKVRKSSFSEEEKKLNQLRYSQTENTISQRELQKFLKKISK